MINCHLSTKFQFRFSSIVHISGVSLNGCLENIVYEVEEFTMENCMLFGTERLLGRALVVTNSTLHIMRSTFTSFHGYESYKGGAIHCSQGHIHVSNSTFTKNSAASGGTLYIEQNSVANIENSVFSHHKDSVCCFEICNGGVIFANFSFVTLSRCIYSNNGFHKDNISVISGALSAYKSNISILWCTFIENIASNGGAVHCHKGTSITISDTKFAYNKAINNGGVIHKQECAIQITGSNFSNNTGVLGGVVYATSSTYVLLLEDSDFNNNTAGRGGVAFYSNSSLNISRCNFGFNKASRDGGVLFLTLNSNVTIISSEFNNNTAHSIGGALRAMNSSRVFILQSASFQRNSAFYGAAIHLYRADQITLTGKIFITNNTATLGIIGIINSKASFSGNMLLIENIGSLFAFGSDISIMGKMVLNRHTVKSPKKGNPLEKKEGGSITLLLSRLDIRGVVSLGHNVARNGGGILAISSRVNVLDSELYVHCSKASDTGGGLFLYQSELYIRGTVNISNNRAQNDGGGIHAISSLITLHIQRFSRVHLHLSSNTANRGGGACLEVNSKFLITQLMRNGSLETARVVHLLNNSATLGGAIYVADDTNIGTCSSGQVQTITAASQSECFFQIIAIGNDIYTFRDAFSFANNSANTSGSLLFGGLLDRCTVNAYSRSPILYSSIPRFVDKIVDGTSSYPAKVCSCSQKDKTICSYEANPVKVKKGENFSLNIVVVDHVNHTTNATTNNYLTSGSGTLGEGQQIFTIGSMCTELSFIVISSLSQHEDLVLFADGPCETFGISPLKVRIDSIPCHCPMGFEVLISVRDRCICVCHNKLLSTVCHSYQGVCHSCQGD